MNVRGTCPRSLPAPIDRGGRQGTSTALRAPHTQWRDRAEIDRDPLGLSLIGLTIGTGVGAIALKFVDPAYFPKLFGVVILLAVLVSAAAPRLVATPRALLAGSTVSGIMGTMAGVHGPAIALVLQNKGPAQGRASLGAFFTVGYIMAVVWLAVLGLFGGADQGIPVSDVQKLDEALDSAGVEHEIAIYPGAPHSFFDRKAVEFAEASTDAWKRALGFIEAHSGTGFNSKPRQQPF